MVKARDAAPSIILKFTGVEKPDAIGLTVAPMAVLDQTLNPVWKVKGMPMLRVTDPFKEVKPRETLQEASILPAAF